MPRIILAVLAGLVLCANLPAAAAANHTDSADRPEFRDRRVEPALERIARQRSALKSGAATVTVVESRSSAAPVIQAVRQAGGVVEATAGNRVQARLTHDQIRRIAAEPSVGYIRLPHTARPVGIKTEGAGNGAIDRFHASGQRGQGVRIAVLDIGFSGYVDQLGSELPDSVSVKNFNARGFETTPHGTAVAEVIHDVAPDAEISLVSFRTDVEFSQALNWIRHQSPKIHVVNASIGFDNVGPLDGTGPITVEADRMLEERDILYLNAAGNERDNYYIANFNDPDGNGWHNFAGDDESLQINLNADETLDAILNWNDWGNNPRQPGSTDDYDLYIWCPGVDSLDPADACLSSTATQSGNDFDRPLERVLEDAPQGGEFRVGILRRSTDGGNRLRLYINDDSGNVTLEYKTPDGTLTLPADGKSVVAVGAYFHRDPVVDFNPDSRPGEPGFLIDDWRADRRAEPYSSRGPTWDGRVKPDLSGPDCVTTATYGSAGFCGTSAATPHAAAAAALLKSEVPSRSGASLRRLLIAMAEDVVPLGADNDHGAGRLSLEPAADKPRISARSGLWNTYRQQGHGFFLEVRADTFLAIWYVYDRKGDPFWLMSVGPMTSDSLYQGDVLSFRGPEDIGTPLSSNFNGSGSTVSDNVVGTMRFEFTGDAEAKVDVALSGDDLIAAADYTVRVTQFLTSPAASSSGLSYASPYSGLWNLPSQNGHGFFINRQAFIRSHDKFLYPTDSLIVTWFGYDGEGEPYWLLGSGLMDEADSFDSAGKSISPKFLDAFNGPSLDGSQPLDKLFDSQGRTISNHRDGEFGFQFDSPAEGTIEFRSGSDIDEPLSVERMDF